MSRYIFYVFWLGVALLMSLLAFKYRDGKDAMVAEVESRVTTISFEKSVSIQKLHVVPGQTVKKGDLLIEVEPTNLNLDLKKTKLKLKEFKVDSMQMEFEYALKRQDLINDYENDIRKIEEELSELKLERSSNQTRKKQFEGLLGIDTMRMNPLVENRMQSLNQRLDLLKIRQSQSMRSNDSIYDKMRHLSSLEIDQIEVDLLELEEERAQLKKYAAFDGTVGNVYVELGEVVASHKRIVSLYESSPSLIKAFSQQSRTKTLNVGQKVKVVSTDRAYEVEGTIESFGSRVTAYPEKIDPQPQMKTYGQEVFIRITPNNRFLNGEKVYVYE